MVALILTVRSTRAVAICWLHLITVSAVFLIADLLIEWLSVFVNLLTAHVPADVYILATVRRQVL